LILPTFKERQLDTDILLVVSIRADLFWYQLQLLLKVKVHKMCFLQAWCDLRIDTSNTRPPLIDSSLETDLKTVFSVYELL